jgi:hypothetical protein
MEEEGGVEVTLRSTSMLEGTCIKENSITVKVEPSDPVLTSAGSGLGEAYTSESTNKAKEMERKSIFSRWRSTQTIRGADPRRSFINENWILVSRRRWGLGLHKSPRRLRQESNGKNQNFAISESI